MSDNNIICVEMDDPIIKKFSIGCNGILLSKAEVMKKMSKLDGPFIVRGLSKYKVINVIKRTGKNFYYIDTGYIGNEDGTKTWHRVIYNDFHLLKIIDRDSKRILKIYDSTNDAKLFKTLLKPWKKDGSKILLCPPTSKTIKTQGVNKNQDEWISSTVEEIKKYTDREIVIRKKPKSRSERVSGANSFLNSLHDVYMVVCFNSNAAVDAVIAGIPILALTDNAARPVGLKKISDIEKPVYPDRESWLCSLSYAQFNRSEMVDGTAWKILLGG